jgi:hypothetical protein
MERAMKNIAEFTIIGRVGSTKTLGKAVRVTIASNYRLKDGEHEEVWGAAIARGREPT